VPSFALPRAKDAQAMRVRDARHEKCCKECIDDYYAMPPCVTMRPRISPIDAADKSAR